MLDQRGADLSRTSAEVVLDGVRPRLVLDGGARPRCHAAAAEAAGVAAWCLRTAVEYAKVREQFGKPIGSFQAVKHLCAEMLCRVRARGGGRLGRRAGRRRPDQHPLAAAVAGAVALDAAVETAKDCIQVLGGIGFTWEHDAHLYLRRALALRQRLGGSARWRRRVAELTAPARAARCGVELGDGEATERTSRARQPSDRCRAAAGAARRRSPTPATSPRTGPRRTVAAPTPPNSC